MKCWNQLSVIKQSRLLRLRNKWWLVQSEFRCRYTHYTLLNSHVHSAEEQQEQQRREEIIQQAENEEDWENDEQFIRLKRMTEMLIEQAQNALLFRAQAAGGRVIMTGKISHVVLEDTLPSPPF